MRQAPIVTRIGTIITRHVGTREIPATGDAAVSTDNGNKNEPSAEEGPNLLSFSTMSLGDDPPVSISH